MLNSRYVMLVAGAAMLSASPALAGPGSPTAQSAVATTYAQIVDPLTITKNVDISFGTLVKSPALTATAVTVTLDGSNTVACPAALLCSGVPTSAKFTVTGTTGQTVYLTTVASLMNGPSGAKLTFTPIAPTTLVAASGPGTSFTFGGSIPVASDTPAGIYNGDVTVTADYN